MHLDLHVSRFDWAGGPSGIGPGVADLAQRAEAIGVRTLSFMDHFFQMDWMAPAERPDARGLHRARLRRRPHRAAAAAPPRHRRDVSPSRAAGQDGDDARRRVGRAGRARHRRGVVRARAPRPRRAVPADVGALRAARGGDPDLPADVERRQRRVRGPALPARRDAVQPDARERAPPADHDRRAAASGRRSGSSPSTPTRATSSAAPDEVAHKIDVLRRHCDAVGRDPNEIEVTAMYRDIPPGATRRRRRPRCRGVREGRRVDPRHRRRRRRPGRLARVDLRPRDGTPRRAIEPTPL